METKRKRPEAKLPVVLNDQELAALLDQPKRTTRTGARNYCLMALMADIGLNTTEVLELRVRDINWMSGRVDVPGDHAKKRTLYMSEALLEELRNWREMKPASDLLFVTIKGKPLNDRYVRSMVKRLSQQAGIEKDISPYTLRHTFAANLYRVTRDLEHLGAVLGHSTLLATKPYQEIVDAEDENKLKGFTLGNRVTA